MGSTDFLFYNGQWFREDIPLINASNRSFRYGDGCFETMKMVNGKLQLSSYHFERLFQSLELLRFQWPAYFTPAYLEKHIAELAEKNGHNTAARIRLTITRGNGGPYDTTDHYPHHVIQTWALKGAGNTLNKEGLCMDIYWDARKNCDSYSAIKSNNYLPNIMAALWVKEKQLDDAFLLNPYERIADATIANVFIVKGDTIITPPLSEGAINGVMRRYLLHCLRRDGMKVMEAPVTTDGLLQASEVFLTNAITGIRWVKQIGENQYGCEITRSLYDKYMPPVEPDK